MGGKADYVYDGEAMLRSMERRSTRQVQAAHEGGVLMQLKPERKMVPLAAEIYLWRWHSQCFPLVPPPHYPLR